MKQTCRAKLHIGQVIKNVIGEIDSKFRGALISSGRQLNGISMQLVWSIVKIPWNDIMSQCLCIL